MIKDVFPVIKTTLLAVTCFFTLPSAVIAQSGKPAYIIYNQEGEEIPFHDLYEGIADSDLIFFGEEHNNSIAHWLRFELVDKLSQTESRAFRIGMEMFEADQQILIDEYFSDLISQSGFEQEARLWNNYQTDYKPMLEFAKEQGIPLTATNIPRRYANSVYRNGLEALDSLSNQAKQWVAPLPIEVDLSLPGYKNISDMAQGHGGENLIYAQAVKDATMAHFILLSMEPETQLFHLNGSYHSDNREGIIWYINHWATGYQIRTIQVVSAENIKEIESDKLQSADFTIAVPENMTKTY